MTTKGNSRYQVHRNGAIPTENDPDVGCGYGKWKPSYLQRWNNPKTLLFVMCIFTLSQGESD